MNNYALAIVFLAVMVIVLVVLGFIQLRQFSHMALRISYLEGTTDSILQLLTPGNE
jgi:DNA-binding transcriptional regulator of glucitol operon